MVTFLKTEGESSLNLIRDLNAEQDRIIESLSLLETHTEQYLSMVNPNQIDTSRDYILAACQESSKIVNEVQKDIDDLFEKLDMPFKSNEEKLKIINYSYGKDKLEIDKNQFTFIMNNFYNSLKFAENMQASIMLKARYAEDLIREVRSEIEKNKNNNY